MLLCGSETFEVEWLLQSEWAAGVLLAHRVFGAMVLVLMITWCALMLEFSSLARAYLISGGCTTCCGMWLIAWVGRLMKPVAPFRDLLEFSLHDLAQLQHAAIGTLLTAAGASELLVASVLSRSRRQADVLRWPHVLWGVCIGWIGVLFMTHPQRTDSETRWHLALGIGLSGGAYSLAVEKWRGQLDNDVSLTEAPLIILACMGFGVAAVLLITFPSPTIDDGSILNSTAQIRNSTAWAPNVSSWPTNATFVHDGLRILHATSRNATVHTGVGVRCQLGTPLTAAGIALGAFALACVCCAAAARACRPSRRAGLPLIELSRIECLDAKDWPDGEADDGASARALAEERLPFAPSEVALSRPGSVLRAAVAKAAFGVWATALALAAYMIILPLLLLVSCACAAVGGVARLVCACRRRMPAPRRSSRSSTSTISATSDALESSHAEIRTDGRVRGTRRSKVGREALAAHDATWIHDTPTQPMIINACLCFSSPRLELSRVQALVLERVIAHAALARFSQVLEADAAAPSGYSWVDDDSFEVSRHVRRVAAAEAPRDDVTMQAMLGRLAACPLPRDRPLWLLLLVEAYEGGGSALIFRCHHVLGDGIAMSGVLLQTLMDPSARPQAECEAASTQPSSAVGNSECDGDANGSHKLGGRDVGVEESELRLSRQHARRQNRLCQTARALYELPVVLTDLLMRGDDYSAMHGLWPLNGCKRIAWSSAVPLEAVKRIKNHYGCGCSVNDVMMTAASAALARYLHELTDVVTSDDAVPSLPLSVRKQLRAACTANATLAVPINTRSAAEMARVRLTNQFAVAFVSVPLAASSRRARLVGMVQRMLELKRSSVPFAMGASLQTITRLLPAVCAIPLVDLVADSATAIVTNNRGPSRWLYFDGRQCTRWVSWAPQRASIGVCLTLYSYAGTVRCSVSADESCLPEPEKLVRYFVEEVEAMAEAVSGTDNR